MLTKFKTAKKPVAIIGMACVFPKAPDLKSFWNNILKSSSSIDEPVEGWEPERYLKSGRINTARGGYLKDLYRFDPRPFGIMPNSIDGGEPDQFLALRVSREALFDAGYLENGYDHSDTGIILGHSTYLHRGQGNLVQHHIVLDQTLELLQTLHPDLGQERLEEVRQLLSKRLPPSNTDIYPGFVPNVMTGRIANRLNLKGPNYLVDGACSSSILAVNAALEELWSNRGRIMLAGGVNASLPPEVAVIFTELGALSKSGRIKPFDKDADGTLLGEGLGVIVLKGLEDALDDGDRVYALIHGTGQSSDGKGQGLLAPSVEGETLAIQRAYGDSGIEPSSITLVEAHGTGIPLGDKTEINALKNVFGPRQRRMGHVAIGSVKSMISHCIPAAGIAGIIKSALALHHKILPPTICESINPDLAIEDTPFYVNTSARPWISGPAERRRAAVNAFGFGGINTHAVLEEAPKEAIRPETVSQWPFELFIFSAMDSEGLYEKLVRLLDFVDQHPEAPMDAVAAALLTQDKGEGCRLALVASDINDLKKKIDKAIKKITKTPDGRWQTRGNTSFATIPLEGKVAFMFPGEGSQYQGMLSELVLFFKEAREWFDSWSSIYNDLEENRTDIIFPPENELTEELAQELEKSIHAMDTGSEAVFIGSQAVFSLLEASGVKPDVIVGHSTGESSALVASGAFGTRDKNRLAGFIKELNTIYRRVLASGAIPTGALLAVGALSREVIEESIGDFEGKTVIAMDNCSNQLIIFGDRDSIERLQTKLVNAGGICSLLPFDRGYHTEYFSSMSRAFREFYEKLALCAPEIPLYSCSSADIFPNDPDSVRELASGQWSSRVRFTETVKKMYDDGVRFFVEVGPSGNLSAFVSDILKEKEFSVLPSDLRRKNSVQQFLSLLAQLYVNRIEMDLDYLFRFRSVYGLSFSDIEAGLARLYPGVLLENTMPVIHLSAEDRLKLKEIVYREEKEKGVASQPFSLNQEVGISDSPTGEGYGLMSPGLSQLAQMNSPDMNEVSEEFDLDEIVSAPFLDVIKELDHEHCIAFSSLNIYEDRFLQDHVLSGKISVYEDMYGLSCIPFMVNLEIMAEASALVAGSTMPVVIEDVASFDWIALDNDEILLEVHAEIIAEAPDKYRAEILNDGRKVVSAVFSFCDEWRLQSLAALNERRTSRWDEHEMYTTGMFHGPLFQSIKKVTGWDDSGIDAQLSDVSLEGFFMRDRLPEFVLNPVLLDAVGQLTAYWIAQYKGPAFNCFPSTIERIELYRQHPVELTGLVLTGRQHPMDSQNDSDGARIWSCECADINNEPIFRIAGLLNIYFPVPYSFYEVRKEPLLGKLGDVYAETEDDILLWELQYLSPQFCSQSGRIFMRILAKSLLSFEEQDEWYTLASKPLTRQMEWLFGRICIKEAVRSWLKANKDLVVYSADLIVVHDEYGAPYVETELNIPLPEVSLSHDKKVALAGVSAPDNRVGVDIEQLDRKFKPELLLESFNEPERSLLEVFEGEAFREKLLCLWCAREAASKYFGAGLQGTPENYRVEFETDWKKAKVWFKSNSVDVRILKRGDCVAAYAC